MNTTTRRSSKAVLLGLTLVGASSLTACGEEPDGAAICTDPQTHERVDDDMCDHAPDNYGSNSAGDNAFLWYYLGTQSSRPIPAVGQPYSGGTYNYRSFSSTHSYTTRGGAPKTGGSSFKSFTKSGGFGGRGGFGG